MCNKSHSPFSGIFTHEANFIFSACAHVMTWAEFHYVLTEKIVIESVLILWVEFLQDSFQPIKKLRNVKKSHYKFLLFILHTSLILHTSEIDVWNSPLKNMLAEFSTFCKFHWMENGLNVAVCYHRKPRCLKF